MNAHTPIVSEAALALAATNADILRTIRAGEFNSAAAIGHACGRPQKNMARDVAVLAREHLVAERTSNDQPFRLTDAGQMALRAVEVAQGLSVDALPADPDVLRVLHHHVRPNPNQPRQHFPREELDGLKATIVSAGDVLDPLLIYPADADGIHMLADGERRWRVVGELIAENIWPADRPLRAIQREHTPGDAAFVGLITAQQGQKLPKMDQARAYRTLCAERGWSARRAALETGEHPKNVQEMLQVLEKADADDIAAFEAGREGWTWEKLRDSVREHREPTADDAAKQLDIEQVTGPGSAAAPPAKPAAPEPKAPPANLVIGGGGAASSQPPKPPRQPGKPDAVLNACQRAAMAELALRLLTPDAHHPADNSPLVRAPKYWMDQTASDLVALQFVVFVHQGQTGPCVAMLEAGRAWLAANIPALDAATVESERQKVPNPNGRGDLGNVTPWLNAAPATPALPGEGEGADDPPAFLGGIGTDGAGDADGGQPDDAAGAHEEADEDALDTFVDLIREWVSKGRGESHHWSNLEAASLAEIAVSSLDLGQPIGAAVALMGLVGKYGYDAASDVLKVVARADYGQRLPLFALYNGDVVSIGGEATGYRLIELARSDVAAGVERPAFTAQPVSLSTGKDRGAQRQVTLHAIQGLVPAKAEG